jgi:hypothetical protein
VGETLTHTLEVAERPPGVMTPLPLEKTPVSAAVPPAEIVVGFATKLVIVGAAGGVVLLPPPLPPQVTINPKQTQARRARLKARAAAHEGLGHPLQ